MQYQGAVREDCSGVYVCRRGGVMAAGLLISLGMHGWLFFWEPAPTRPTTKNAAPILQAVFIAPPTLPASALSATQTITPEEKAAPTKNVAPQQTPKPALQPRQAPASTSNKPHSDNSPATRLQGADAYRQYYNAETLQAPSSAEQLVSSGTQPQSAMARTQRQLSATRNLHGDTYIETASGQCFKTLSNTPPGQATNWYATRCHNHKTDEEKMLENVQREMDKRFR